MIIYLLEYFFLFFFFFQAEDGIRDLYVTGVQTCALPILPRLRGGEPVRLRHADRARLLGVVVPPVRVGGAPAHRRAGAVREAHRLPRRRHEGLRTRRAPLAAQARGHLSERPRRRRQRAREVGRPADPAHLLHRPPREGGRRAGRRGRPPARRRRRPSPSRSTRLSTGGSTTSCSGSMLERIPVAFAAGLFSVVTPCVLPLVPGYLSSISAIEADRLGEPRAARRVAVASL